MNLVSKKLLFHVINSKYRNKQLSISTPLIEKYTG